MQETMSRMGQQGHAGDAQKHTEGFLARTIEDQTAKLPSDVFMWAAFAAIGGSLLLHAMGKKEDSNFVGHWAPTFLIFGLYNKIVKTHGHDQLTGHA
jgi:hypothetical protein